MSLKIVGAGNFHVASTTVVFDLPPGKFTATRPIVLVTVEGAPTDVDVQAAPEYLAQVGEVYRRVTLTFQPAAVGKRASALVLES